MQTTANTVEIVSFDLWKTLITSNPTPNRASRAKDLFAMFRPDMSFVDFATVVADAETHADKLSESTEQHYGPKERTSFVAQRVGATMLSDDDFTAFYNQQSERFMQFPPHLMQPDIPEVLGALRGSGRKVALISNTGFVNGREMRRALELTGITSSLVDYAVFSDEVGVNKPNKRIFEQLIDASQTVPQHILHIGDNYTADYEGATAAGMQAIHLKPEDTIAGALSYLLQGGK